LGTIYIQTTAETTAPGPYSIYANTLDSAPLATNVSLQDLRAAVSYSVSPDPANIILVNNNPACLANIVTVNTGLGPTPTPTPTLTPTITPTFTPTITPTPTPTILPPTPTPTPVTITVTLTIDAGNTGYTEIWYQDATEGSPSLHVTLSTTSTVTVNVPTGNIFYVKTFQTSRAFSYQLAEIIFRVNGNYDFCSPYLQRTLGAVCELICPAIYAGGYPTVTLGNTYRADTYIGNQR
jgi:hypothetical protein